MSEWLVIQLIAPLASFGELAGSTRRGGRDRPGKGALLGLLGAALGVRREDAAGQEALATGYAVASRTWRPGRILQDFHTFQSAPTPKTPYATRAEALASGNTTTSITVREYRSDVVFDAAYRAREQARWPLQRLEEALRKPAFTLFLGRKSCPLAAPLDPMIIEADTPIAAFEAARRGGDWETLFFPDRKWVAPRPKSVALEEEDARAAGLNSGVAERRRDQPGDRVRWHFGSRIERVIPLSNQGREGDA